MLNEEQYTATIPEGATPQQVASTLANIDVRDHEGIELYGTISELAISGVS